MRSLSGDTVFLPVSDVEADLREREGVFFIPDRPQLSHTGPTVVSRFAVRHSMSVT
jgi:hypothetical protein